MIFLAHSVPKKKQYVLILVAGVMRHLTAGIHLRTKYKTPRIQDKNGKDFKTASSN